MRIIIIIIIRLTPCRRWRDPGNGSDQCRNYTHIPSFTTTTISSPYRFLLFLPWCRIFHLFHLPNNKLNRTTLIEPTNQSTPFDLSSQCFQFCNMKPTDHQVLPGPAQRSLEVATQSTSNSNSVPSSGKCSPRKMFTPENVHPIHPKFFFG